MELTWLTERFGEAGTATLGGLAIGVFFGACLMGFGGMLAGGCAVGAGVTGGAVLALTSWCALTAMWVGAGVTDMLVDRDTVHLPRWLMLRAATSK